MVRKIFIWLLIAMALGVVVLWFLGGGVQKIVANTSGFPLSISGILSASSSWGSFGLPGAPQLPQIPEAYDGGGGNEPGNAPNGANSPYAGQVVLAQAAAQTGTASGQYLEISLSPGASPVDIAGWTLQSALSAALATIPQAVPTFRMNTVNTVGAATLKPGGIAYVVSGASPVGVSFAENECTGYLGTLQPFVPALPLSCPSPSSEIPDTAQNEAAYGAACMQYISRIPPCTFPSNPPSDLSPACIQKIQTVFSYNGCLAAHASDPNFATGSWRLYLSHNTAIWNPQHDVIRLLDGEGRVVSVVNY